MRDDELKYMLFASMRVQYTSERKGLALPAHKKGDRHRHTLAKRIVDYFSICELYRDGEGQDRAAMEAFFAATLDAMPLPVLQGFGSDISGIRERARYDAAHLLFDALDGFDVLIDTPQPPPMRFANYDGGSGVPAMAG